MRRVRNALTRREGVGVFGGALLRREGVRGFGFGIGCSGVIQMARDGRRQVGVGRIGVGTVTVVTDGGDPASSCGMISLSRGIRIASGTIDGPRAISPSLSHWIIVQLFHSWAPSITAHMRSLSRRIKFHG